MNVTNEKATNIFDCDLAMIMQKLDLLQEKSPSLPPVEYEQVAESKNRVSIKIRKQATCLSDMDDSSFKFYPGEFGRGSIRCEKYFNMICDNSPVLQGTRLELEFSY